MGVFADNTIEDSVVFNQFIFGNAYPADIVIVNNSNVNIFELKKGNLNLNSLIAIRKEIQ